MQRKTPFVAGEFYHVYNRGVDKRKIFDSERDYERFIALLYLANSEENVRIDNLLRKESLSNILSMKRGLPLVAIGSFCLMPNHFHLLLTPLAEKGISQFMLKLQTGYSMYFNIKNNRTGSLFQGPFKSKHAKDDLYLKYLFSYIHLNPASLHEHQWESKTSSKNKTLLRFVKEYPYSSFASYLLGEHRITNPAPFPDYFGSPETLEKHIVDWLELEQG